MRLCIEWLNIWSVFITIFIYLYIYISSYIHLFIYLYVYIVEESIPERDLQVTPTQPPCTAYVNRWDMSGTVWTFKIITLFFLSFHFSSDETAKWSDDLKTFQRPWRCICAMKPTHIWAGVLNSGSASRCANSRRIWNLVFLTAVSPKWSVIRILAYLPTSVNSFNTSSKWRVGPLKWSFEIYVFLLINIDPNTTFSRNVGDTHAENPTLCSQILSPIDNFPNCFNPSTSSQISANEQGTIYRTISRFSHVWQMILKWISWT